MLEHTVAREFLETSLAVRATNLAYVSESIDERLGLHVVNCTFWVVEEDDTAHLVPQDRHVAEARFVAVDEALKLLRADVLRIPVGNALRRASEVRYYAFRPEDIEIPFLWTNQQ